MAAECGGAIHVCAFRATLLDDDGGVADGPDNSYVTDQVLELGYNPVLLQGVDVDVQGACDCVVASYAGEDKLKRFDFALARHAIEPILEHMLLGGQQIIDGADVVGLGFAEQLPCGERQPLVAIEFWADNWEDDAPVAARPYWHFVYPATKWQLGPNTHNNEFVRRQLVGKSRRNGLWGRGRTGTGRRTARRSPVAATGPRTSLRRRRTASRLT